jgi:hypothetical protein
MFYFNKRHPNMLSRLIFRFFSERKQIEYLKENGVALGTRLKNNRKTYLYLVNDFCVEVFYKLDNDQLDAERIITFPTVKDFNNYLESEFKATY